VAHRKQGFDPTSHGCSDSGGTVTLFADDDILRTARAARGRISATDGPFAETKEVLGGSLPTGAARDEPQGRQGSNP
jgi:hypothetical protein